MPELILGIGSNIAPEQNIRLALPKLEKHFGELRISPIYESPSVGFEGDNFLNFVVSAEVDQGLEQIVTILKQIESEQGRKRNESKYSSRHIDIDILLYGDLCGQFDSICLPREDILLYDFVLKPLVDLCPDACHPVNKKTFDQLWTDYQISRDVNLTLSEFQLLNVYC